MTSNMASAGPDATFIASYSGLALSHIQSLLSSPTPALVTSFLQAIVARAQEHERLKADRLRLDVELENAVRGGEAKVRALKATYEKSLSEVETLRTQLQEQRMSIALSDFMESS